MILKVPETREEYVHLVSVYEHAIWLADVVTSQFRLDCANEKAIECEKLFEQCKFYIDEDGLWCEKEEN
jgi:hypothetical protein